MKRLHERIDSWTSDTRKEKITIVDRELNSKLKELARQGKKKVVVSYSGLVNLSGIPERSLRNYAVLEMYQEHIDGCNYERYQGLKINLKKYCAETEILPDYQYEELFEE